MYLSTEQPAHSIRAHGEWLLVGGESHKTGQADAAERYARLEAWARERFGIEPELRWATQDQMPADGVPYVGRHDPLSSGVWVATGFRKWGLAMGTAAAELLAAQIAGRDHPWADLFNTRRLRARAGATSFVKENANVALRFFGDRVVKRGHVEEIGPGEGRIVGAGHGQRAVYRDDEGDPARALRPLHPPRLHRQLELRRAQLGLPLPRVPLCRDGRGHRGPGGAPAHGFVRRPSQHSRSAQRAPTVHA